MKTETVNNQTIKCYIDGLISSYGIYPIINEAALKIQFDHNLYAECVLEVMRKMGLQNRVKVTCYPDYKYPCKTSVARIHLPVPFPSIFSQTFKTMQLQVEICAIIKTYFYTFISSIAHELAHVVMHSTNHKLLESEVATDLCVLVFGFQNFVIKGKSFDTVTFSGIIKNTKGYLSEEQLKYAVNYINAIRK